MICESQALMNNNLLVMSNDQGLSSSSNANIISTLQSIKFVYNA